jgi:hypothetical protein
MKTYVVSEQNLKALEALIKVISIEEGRETSFDQALGRVIGYYRKAVPFN